MNEEIYEAFLEYSLEKLAISPKEIDQQKKWGRGVYDNARKVGDKFAPGTDAGNNMVSTIRYARKKVKKSPDADMMPNNMFDKSTYKSSNKYTKNFTKKMPQKETGNVVKSLFTPNAPKPSDADNQAVMKASGKLGNKSVF